MGEEISVRYLNESAIRSHALKCSQLFRANKFTRVGQDFIDEVQTDVECLVRSLRKETTLHDPAPVEVTFTTGALLDHIQPVLNDTIGKIIQNKVQRQPTVGKTLSRTR